MAMEYLLTFADIPFIADVAKIVRMEPQAPTAEPGSAEPPRKHQPNADLIEELDRLLPFAFIQDKAPLPNFISRNMAGLARRWPVDVKPQEIRIGEWFYPSTATRWSVFRGLATSAMAKAMLAAVNAVTPTFTGVRSGTFIMKANPIAPYHNDGDQNSYTLESEMYMLPPRPLGELGGKFDGLYLITLVDERYHWQYNPVSLHVPPGTTWLSLITQLGTALGVSITTDSINSSYAVPEADSTLWTNMENAGLLLDAIAYCLGCTVVRSLSGSYTIQSPSSANTVVLANRGDVLRVARTAGGDLFSSGTLLPVGNLTKSKNLILPEKVRTTFPKYYLSDPVPHIANSRYAWPRPSAWIEDSYGDVYSIDISLSSGGSALSGLTGLSGRIHTIHSTAKALLSGEQFAFPTNLSGLTALAMQTAGDYYNAQVGPSLDEAYPGTYAWTPEGTHDIVWTYSSRARQATTRVFRSEWNQIIREMHHATPSVSGGSTNPIGVGGPSVAQTWRSQTSGQPVITSITSILTSGGYSTGITSTGAFPTQNRWKGRLENEIILFEGTSGGLTVNIAQRGIDGTLQTSHAAGTVITMLTGPQTYGNNLITFEKGQYVAPGITTSGGIAETVIIPQNQTVRALSASGVSFYGVRHYSGQVNVYDSAKDQTLGHNRFQPLEYVWLTERNSGSITSGKYYEGMFTGYSPDPVSPATTTAPVYVVSEDISGGGPSPGITAEEDDGSPRYTNVTTLQVHSPTFTLSQPATDTALISVNFGSSIAAVGSTNSAGSSSQAPREDHVHAIAFPTCYPSTPTVGMPCFDGSTVQIWNGSIWIVLCPCDTTGSGGSGTGCWCSYCPTGSPQYWIFSITASGDFADAFEDWTLTAGADCTWSQTNGTATGVLSRDNADSTYPWKLKIDFVSGAKAWYKSSNFLCCDVNEFFLYSISGTGDIPNNILIAPEGTCTVCPGGSGGGGSTVLTACCPAAIPTTLTGSFTNRLGACTCLPDTVTFTWNASTSQWEATTTVCSGKLLTLACTGANCSQFVLKSSGTATGTQTSCTCTPALEIVFDINAAGSANLCTVGGPGNTATLTIMP